ncbi:putative membrane protein, partial [Yersinia pestis PY-54]
MPTLLFFLL